RLRRPGVLRATAPDTRLGEHAGHGRGAGRAGVGVPGPLRQARTAGPAARRRPDLTGLRSSHPPRPTRLPRVSNRVVAVLGRGVVPADTPILRADDLGVLRGDGVFETL